MAATLTKRAPVLVTFARPEESCAFLRQARLTAAEGRSGLRRGELEGVKVAVGFTGIGQAAAKQRIELFLKQGPWSAVVAAGFAGGLDPALRVGDTVVEWFPTQAARRIVTRDFPVESSGEKAQLFRECGAAVVDMETAVIADACAEAGVPFVAVRAVSDPADSDLPVPFGVWFDLERQRPRIWALMRYLLGNPGRIAPFARFVRGLGIARRNLAAQITRELLRPTGGRG